MNAQTRTVTIKTTPEKAFQYLSRVENLLSFAPVFAESISDDNGRWIAKRGAETFELKIVSDPHWGVVDFHIIPAPGILTIAPSRVVPNGPDTEYIFTLFQATNMDDQTYQQTVNAMRGEFELLRVALEA